MSGPGLGLGLAIARFTTTRSKRLPLPLALAVQGGLTSTACLELVKREGGTVGPGTSEYYDSLGRRRRVPQAHHNWLGSKSRPCQPEQCQ